MKSCQYFLRTLALQFSILLDVAEESFICSSLPAFSLPWLSGIQNQVFKVMSYTQSDKIVHDQFRTTLVENSDVFNWYNAL